LIADNEVVSNVLILDVELFLHGFGDSKSLEHLLKWTLEFGAWVAWLCEI